MSSGGGWQEGMSAGAESENPLAKFAFLMDPVGILRRRWSWMLAATAVGLVATGVAYQTWTPVYIAQARMLVTSQQIPEEFVRPTVEQDSINNINAMIGESLSTDNLARMVEEVGLGFPGHGDQTLLATVRRIRAGIEIAPLVFPSKRDTSIVYGISFSNTDPERAATVANAVTTLLVEVSVRRRNEQARQATHFLQAELERDEAELRELSARVAEFRRAHRGELPEELNVNLSRVQGLAEKRQQTLAQTREAEARLADLRGSGGSGEPGTSEVVLAELRRRLAEEVAIHTEEHPNVTSLQRRILVQEAEVAAERSGERGHPPEIQRQIEREQGDLARLRSRLAEIDVESRDLSERIDRTPAVAEELNGLLQEEMVLREGYLDSLRKVEEAERAESLEASQQAAQATILDRARPPTAPEIPASLVLLAGIAGTFVLAVAVGVLLEFLDPVIVSAAQLDHVAQRPVLGALPRFE